MPRCWIVALSDAVLTPGSPDASFGAGSGSPSVCAISYLGIQQPGHGNAALVAAGDTCMAQIREVPVATCAEHDYRVC